MGVLLFVALAGFLASLVDGALGMASGRPRRRSC